MYDYKHLSELMERTIHKYNQFEKKGHTYPGNLRLTHAEIHTISFIGDYPGLNLTSLAKIKGITKSGASQMVYRLRDKGLVNKEVSANSDAAICITLTDLGQKVYEMHNSYHKNTNSKLNELLKQIPESTAQEMEKFLQKFDDSINEWEN